jgi:hypothetical protein
MTDRELPGQMALFAYTPAMRAEHREFCTDPFCFCKDDDVCDGPNCWCAPVRKELRDPPKR